MTDFAAPSGLMVEPQPATSNASEAIMTTNAVRIAEVCQKQQTVAANCPLMMARQAADVTR